MMATKITITIRETETNKLMQGYKCTITLSISGKQPNTFPAITNNDGYFVVNTAPNTLITITKNVKKIGAVLANKSINYYTAYSPKVMVKNCVCSDWKSIASDSKGNYFYFFDNAHSASGTSLANKLYCNCEKFSLIGKPDPRNVYANGRSYIVSTIRESVKAK
jgi:hypothetical protein